MPRSSWLRNFPFSLLFFFQFYLLSVFISLAVLLFASVKTIYTSGSLTPCLPPVFSSRSLSAVFPIFLSVRHRCLLTSALSISSLNPSRLLFLASWPLCPRSFSFLYLSCSIPSSDRILRAEPRPSPLTRDPVFLGSSELHIYPFISASFRELCSSFVFSIFCLTPIPFSCLPLFPFVWIIDLGREFDLQSLRKWYLNDFRLTIPFRIARRHVWKKGNCI